MSVRNTLPWRGASAQCVSREETVPRAGVPQAGAGAGLLSSLTPHAHSLEQTEDCPERGRLRGSGASPSSPATDPACSPGRTLQPSPAPTIPPVIPPTATTAVCPVLSHEVYAESGASVLGGGTALHTQWKQGEAPQASRRTGCRAARLAVRKHSQSCLHPQLEGLCGDLLSSLQPVAGRPPALRLCPH